MECGSVHGCDSTKSLPTQKSQRKKAFLIMLKQPGQRRKKGKLFLTGMLVYQHNHYIIWE